MINNIHYVIEPIKYESIARKFSEVFRFDNDGFPDDIFLEKFSTFKFIEFDRMVSSAFWLVLQEYSRHYGDSNIYMLVVDPDAKEYYKYHFGYFGMLEFSLNDSEDDYYQTLSMIPPDSPADALVDSSRIVAYCGSTGSWGFWGERDLGFGISANCMNETFTPNIAKITWCDLDMALKNWIAPNFQGDLIPTEFMTQVRQHYSAK